VRKIFGGTELFYRELAVENNPGNHPSVRELTPELRAVVHLAGAAQGAYEVEGLLLRVCRSVAETFGFERVAISEHAEERREVVPLVACGIPPEAVPDEPFDLEEAPVFAEALESSEVVFSADVREGDLLPAELVEAFGITSLVTVPLVTGGRCLGFLSADRGGERFELEREQVVLLGAIGALVAVFLEKALAHESLQRLDELKSTFIALASHELRTPAAVVHGIAATLQLRGPELAPGQVFELRKALYEQTDRLRRLVDQLLDLSRMEAGGVSIRPEPIRIRPRLEELVLMVAGDRTGEIVLEVEPELETFADPTALERIVANLIVNALRYGAAPITVTAELPDRHFRLSVEDRGDGVPPEFVPQLFERFTRSTPSPAKVESGAGLGLAIARSYALAHGGELLYAPATPRGARFELVLPAGPSLG
jgi:signal transduction histidine kinase